MRKLPALIALACVLCGCAAPRNAFLEGSQTVVGAYLPYEGQLFGVEVVQHVSGCYVRASTNGNFQVERVYAATNEYLWGAVRTRESSHTKVCVPAE